MCSSDLRQLIVGKDIVYSDEQLAEILSPRHFVDVRKTHGGPSPSEVLRAIKASKDLLAADEGWLRETRDRLRGAAHRLKLAADQL